KSRTIRIPVHIVEREQKISRAERALMTTLERDPTDEEIAEKSKLSLKHVQEVRAAARAVTSLDKPVGTEGDAAFGDLIAGENADQLIVHFRPRRSWGTLAFLAFWLTFWTAGGIAAFTQLLHGDLGARLFILLWLCFWAFGEATVAVIIAWQLLGHELLLVSPEQLEVRKQIGPFTKTKLYEVPLVRDLEAARARGDEDERPRKDFCLAFEYNDKPVCVGEGMSEREAEHI